MTQTTPVRQRLAEAVDLQNAQRHEEAVAAFEALLQEEADPASPVRVLMLDGLGRSWHMLGQLGKARQAFEDSLHLLEQVFGPEHPHVAGGLQNFSRVLAACGEYVLARQTGLKAVELLRAAVDKEHPRLADALLNLSSIHYDSEAFTEAEACLREAQDIWTATLGADSVPVSTCWNNRGRILERQGKPEEGARLHEKAVDIRRRLLGQHPETAFSLGNWGAALADAGQWAKAQAVLEEALLCYEYLGMRDEEAACICRQNLEVCRKSLRG